MRRPAIERFEEKIARTPGGCWRWLAAGVPHGYGVFYFDGRQGYAHRFAYQHFVGSIPDGWVIDHLCRNRRCVNPMHLQAVTYQVNLLRGLTIAAQNAGKTRCKNGHLFTPENTYTYASGSRACRSCNTAAARAKRDRLKGAA